FDIPSATYLGGCSLGGHFSLEVLLRRPDAFGAWAGVQTAINEAGGGRYARKLADVLSRSGPPAPLGAARSGGPFRGGHAALSSGLTRAGVANTFVELPGPHDQRWLKASGTERMLGWLDALPRP